MNKLESPKAVNRLALLFALTYMASYMTRINYGAVISEMVLATGMSKRLVSMAVTGSFITYGVGQIVSGLCGDRFRPKKLIFIGLMVSVCMNLLLPLWENHIYMLVIWSLNGFAQAFMWPPMVKLMSELLSAEDYKKTTTRVSWGSSCGTIAIYLISPLLISRFGWKSVFLFSALWGIVMLVVWNRFCYDLSPAPAVTVSGGEKKDRKNVLFNPLMLSVMAAIMLQGMLRDGVTTWMPSYIAETYQISNIISILTGVLLPVFSIVYLQICNRLYRTLFRTPVSCGAVFFGCGALAAALLVFITGKNAAVSVFSSALLTGCMHGVNLMLICMIPPFFSRYNLVSTASGVLNACTYVGSAVSTYVIALFAEQFGWLFNIKLWFVIAALGCVLCLISIKPWNRRFGQEP